MTVIDSDAHVVETELTWEFMEEWEAELKPEVLVPKSGGEQGILDGRRPGYRQEQQRWAGYAG